ncbi:MAG: lytic polysaccharide monooxygenase [Deltaproteobacteria bacterium]|nr:lytic polysaccharide monooxygenase [Deltaproteobacteria bacterium]
MRTVPSSRLLFIATILAGVGFSSLAHAHLALVSHDSRYGGGSAEIKQGPCGISGMGRSANVYTYESGTTITVEWNEYIDHPGHFRIAFDDDGDDDFTKPPCLSNCDSGSMVIGVAPADYTDATVLIDGIASTTEGGRTSYDVTLPDVECDNCTLQVIQVMTDKPPYETSGGNDLYFQCIDLVLRRGTGTDGGVIVMDSGTDGGPTPVDSGTVADSGGEAGDGGGCSVANIGARPTPLTFMLSVVPFVILGRRALRRRR